MTSWLLDLLTHLPVQSHAETGDRRAQVWTAAQEDLRLLLNPLRPPGCAAMHG